LKLTRLSLSFEINTNYGEVQKHKRTKKTKSTTRTEELSCY